MDVGLELVLSFDAFELCSIAQLETTICPLKVLWYDVNL